MDGTNPAVDIDRYLATHEAAWARLADLTRRAGRAGRDLSPPELDELVALYQAVSGHLSYVRTAFGDPALVSRLSALVGGARHVIYGARPRRGLRSAVDRLLSEFPLAVWRIRRFVVAAAALLLLPGVAVGAWLAVSDRAVEASAPAAVREAYLEEDFEAYYSSEPAAQFATDVFVNNVRVAVLAFAAGLLVCVVTAGLLAFNGANVGVAGGLFHAAGEAPRFWGLILPHGLLELSAVVVAGAAGLALGWAVIAPGDRTRGEAVADEARRAVPVVLGLVAAFFVAGVIEGFVTGSGLPTALRVGVGIAAAGAFWAWIVAFGRPAPAERAQSEPVALARR